MSHTPKLETFKIKLINKEDGRAISFRELFRKKLNLYQKSTKPVTQHDFFRTYYQDFMKQLDSKGYVTNKKKKKAFTIANDIGKAGKRVSHISPPTATDMIINGILEGGKHNLRRWLGAVTDTSNKQEISTKHVVSDRFYFLLYTPLDHSEAILMVQGYTESKISDAFKDYLLDYFKYNKEIISQIEIAIPQEFKKEYLENAVFKKLRFTSGWVAKPDLEGVKEKAFELEVKIEIIDHSKDKSHFKEALTLMKAFGKSTFQPNGGNKKELENFDTKQAKMTNGKKEMTIDLDDENNIKPVILLTDQGIDVTQDGIPDFEQINNYCRQLLTRELEHESPQNAIKEL